MLIPIPSTIYLPVKFIFILVGILLLLLLLLPLLLSVFLILVNSSLRGLISMSLALKRLWFIIDFPLDLVHILRRLVILIATKLLIWSTLCSKFCIPLLIWLPWATKPTFFRCCFFGEIPKILILCHCLRTCPVVLVERTYLPCSLWSMLSTERSVVSIIPMIWSILLLKRLFLVHGKYLTPIRPIIRNIKVAPIVKLRLECFSGWLSILILIIVSIIVCVSLILISLQVLLPSSLVRHSCYFFSGLWIVDWLLNSVSFFVVHLVRMIIVEVWWCLSRKVIINLLIISNLLRDCWAKLGLIFLHLWILIMLF